MASARSAHSDLESADRQASFASPYRYQIQFDHAMDEACSRYFRTQGTWLERRGPHFALFVYLAFVVPAVSIWFLGAPWLGPVVFVTVLFAPVLLFAQSIRLRRLRRRIICDRLCLSCFYPLHGAPLDAGGAGRCPECGSPFTVQQYERPPKRIHRYSINDEKKSRAES
ncbi:MAG: hypothetical protein ACF8PN_11460 [Phycisphaerales bacterium]